MHWIARAVCGYPAADHTPHNPDLTSYRRFMLDFILRPFARVLIAEAIRRGPELREAFGMSTLKGPNESISGQWDSTAHFIPSIRQFTTIHHDMPKLFTYP